MYYLFGAGSFCTSVIGFCGVENIIGIIDNNESKVGDHIKGKEIISYGQFKEKYANEPVIITVQLFTDEIVKQLEEDGIDNYLIFPFIQTSYYTAQQIIDRWKFEKKECIYTLGYPVLSKIIGYLLGGERVFQLEEKEDKSVDEVYLLEEMQVRENANIHYVNLWKQMQKEIQITYNRLHKFKMRYKGQRCFLIGNGPSLRAEDLDKIAENQDISFACNRIHLIYDSTKWRPDFYFLIDGKEFEYNKRYLCTENQISFVKDFIGNDILPDNKCVFPFRNKDYKFYPGYPQFSPDVTDCCYGGRTTMYQMIQFACFMGFSEIYLLGVDFSWGENGENTHFVNGYTDSTSIQLGKVFKEEVEHAYIAAKNYADEKKIKIFNATRGGKLEVFKRINFDELF